MLHYAYFFVHHLLALHVMGSVIEVASWRNLKSKIQSNEFNILVW